MNGYQEVIQKIREKISQELSSSFPDVEEEKINEMVDRMVEVFLSALISEIMSAVKNQLLLGVNQALAVLSSNPLNTVGAWSSLQAALQTWQTEEVG